MASQQDETREVLLKSIANAASGTKVAKYLAQLAYAYSCVVAPGSAGAPPSDEK